MLEKRNLVSVIERTQRYWKKNKQNLGLKDSCTTLTKYSWNVSWSDSSLEGNFVIIIRFHVSKFVKRFKQISTRRIFYVYVPLLQQAQRRSWNSRRSHCPSELNRIKQIKWKYSAWFDGTRRNRVLRIDANNEQIDRQSSFIDWLNYLPQRIKSY